MEESNEERKDQININEHFKKGLGTSFIKIARGCVVCGKGRGESLRVCGACKAVHYCSRECQKSDWKKHKTICKVRQTIDNSFANGTPADQLFIKSWNMWREVAHSTGFMIPLVHQAIQNYSPGAPTFQAGVPMSKICIFEVKYDEKNVSFRVVSIGATAVEDVPIEERNKVAVRELVKNTVQDQIEAVLCVCRDAINLVPLKIPKGYDVRFYTDKMTFDEALERINNLPLKLAKKQSNKK